MHTDSTGNQHPSNPLQKVWMTILRISTCEAVSEMTVNLSLQSQCNKTLPDFSHFSQVLNALYTDSP